MTARELLAELAEMAKSTQHSVPSPCISVCRFDGDSGLCLGCYRTLDEIAAWSRAGDDAKRVVWGRITQRAGLNTG